MLTDLTVKTISVIFSSLLLTLIFIRSIQNACHQTQLTLDRILMTVPRFLIFFSWEDQICLTKKKHLPKNTKILVGNGLQYCNWQFYQ